MNINSVLEPFLLEIIFKWVDIISNDIKSIPHVCLHWRGICKKRIIPVNFMFGYYDKSIDYFKAISNLYYQPHYFDTKFNVSHLNKITITNPSDQILIYISENAPILECLELNTYSYLGLEYIGPDGFSSLTNIKSLKKLRLVSSKMTHECLSKFKYRLTHLLVNNSNFSDELLEGLNPDIEVLEIPNCRNITDEGLISFSERCPKLRLLNINDNWGITDSAIAPFYNRNITVKLEGTNSTFHYIDYNIN
jgi:hypothetical protein